MTGRSPLEIKEEQKELLSKVQEKYNNDTWELLDSYIDTDQSPIWCLGQSLLFLDMSDAIVFSENWMNSKGCKIEHLVALIYNIPILEV